MKALKPSSTIYTVPWWRSHRREHLENVSHQKSCSPMEWPFVNLGFMNCVNWSQLFSFLLWLLGTLEPDVQPACSIEGLGKYLQADFIPSDFYPEFLPQFRLCSSEWQA